MDNTGWIKLYREILNNPIVCKDADHFAIWNYLLLSATHKSYDVVFGKDRITLQAGQLITGRKVIADKFKINETKVQRILKAFENAQQIEQQTSNKNRLITIVNWATFQSNEQQEEQQVNNRCTTDEQQVNTNKNDKKEKKEKKTIYTPFFEELWALYPKKEGKATTSKKVKKLLKEYTEEELLNCVKAYVRDITKKRTDTQYICIAYNFFNEKFLNYLGVKEVNSAPKISNDIFPDVFYDEKGNVIEE